MLATQVRQKDGALYFVTFSAEDVLSRVRFISRFYGEGGQIAPEPVPEGDDVARLVSRIEKSDRAFQRTLSRPKVRAIKNFCENAGSQPPIPCTVLLFTPERLAFRPGGGLTHVGDLELPSEKCLINDGHHRLAALRFYLEEQPEEARTISVPCVIFNGRSDDCAAEMFVIINSTPTRINKSHLVDLYERVHWAAPDRKPAAKGGGHALQRAGQSPAVPHQPAGGPQPAGFTKLGRRPSYMDGTGRGTRRHREKTVEARPTTAACGARIGDPGTNRLAETLVWVQREGLRAVPCLP